MTYYTGMIAAVPTAKRQAYIDHLHRAWHLLHKHGASRMVEGWGVDVPTGKVTDLRAAVQARADETVIFTWIEWPDRATSDAAWSAMPGDPDVAALDKDMPFDGKRLIQGGFEPLMEAGTVHGAPYYQGFLLAVPEQNKAAYDKMARDAWPMFEKYGCLGIAENWGVDVPHGKLTDMYRATKAEPGEVAVFSWTAWPDRATCDRASQQMMSDMQGQPMPEMPFDGMRMMWGGFQTIFDSTEDGTYRDADPAARAD